MKLIMFDYDGVIVDSFKYLKSTYQKIGRVLHIPMNDNDEYFRELIELDWMQTYKKLNIIAKDEVSLSEFIFHIESDKKKDQIKVYKDIPIVLQKLSKKYKLAIVSNNYKKSVIPFLKRNNLNEYISIVFGCEEGKIKPNPDLLIKCMNHFGVSNKESIFIGDMDGDIIAGKRAGVKTVAVTYGYHLKHRLMDADIIIDNPMQILDILN